MASAAPNGAAAKRPAAPSSAAPPPGGLPERAVAQMTKLRDANTKYKGLLKMAKERIQTQEEELEGLREETRKARGELAAEKVRSAELRAAQDAAMDGMGGPAQARPRPGPGQGADGAGPAEGETVPVRVYQRIRADGGADAGGGAIWALIEYETFNPDQLDNPTAPTPRRHDQWRKFDAEAQLDDHVRRETGEPIVLPPYSLSPQQSARIEDEAARAVGEVTEEFRRFRVRSEVARKQADATVRALQSSNVQKTRRRIEGQDVDAELAQARTDHRQVATLRAEMAEQEARWEEAYGALRAENDALRSSGAEALLAAQWRQRYEACLREKESLESKLEIASEKAGGLSDKRRNADAGKYEMKYRDLKESFRLYRKKAKEIFEAQQRGVEGGTIQAGLMSMSEGTEEAKLAYLRNLMVNYLSADPTVRDHMEGAIGTVLKFSPQDFKRIAEGKTSAESSWF